MRLRMVLAGVFCLLLASGASVAFASVDYPVNESLDGAQEATTVIDPDTGGSAWWYQDLQDIDPKNEGGYAVFDTDTAATWYEDDPEHLLEDGVYLDNPHGGYDTATNKCKVCHAVHRAEGAYYLLRSDSQDDACNYCHIGGSAHSRMIVYDSDPAGIYTANGHTIGASSIIPGSSVNQWLEEETIETIDANMEETSTVVNVRRYYERRNAMFRFGRHHGQSATSADSQERRAYERIGPLALRCMNCHQPHNATELVWKPSDIETGEKLADGYKLLRLSPSGSIAGEDLVASGTTADEAMIDRLSVAASQNSGVGLNNVIATPEDDIGPDNTGEGHTIWTEWPDTSEAYGGEERRDPSIVNQYALSVWCADCHNLNIGYYEEVPMEFGFKSHGDRTHPAPFVGGANGPGQCYSCHRNDMSLTNTTADEYGEIPGLSPIAPGHDSCDQCHYGTYSYWNARDHAESEGHISRYDFPHSGGSGEYDYEPYIKLLGPWTAYIDEDSGHMVTTQTAITSDNLDAVCLRCHPGIGVRH